MNILSQSKVLKHRQKTLSAIELVSRTTENGKGKHHALCYDNDDADIDNDDVLLWAKLLMNLKGEQNLTCIDSTLFTTTAPLVT